MRAASDRIVPVSLELGGKSPSIVFPDANEDWVIDGIIAAMRFTRQSQSCTAGSRLFLHARYLRRVPDALGQKMKALKLGDPLDEASDIGTIINKKQFSKVCGYVDEGLKRREARARVRRPAAQGRAAQRRLFRDPHHLRERGERLAPCARGNLRPRAGRHPLDATRRTRSAWRTTATTGLPPTSGRTTSVSALRAAHAIEAGWVQVNQGLGQTPGHSYGGYKESGIGREFSLEGMLESYTQRKNVTVNLVR